MMMGRADWYVFVFGVLLSAAPCLCEADRVPFVASFLTASSREECRKYLDTTGILFRHDSSTTKVGCEYMPIEYNPQPSPEKYAQWFGAHQGLVTLGYVHDRHVQAFLVHVDVGYSGSPEVLSKFNNPYVTVSDAGTSVYNSDYSNVLWNRFEAANIIYCFRDKYGKPYGCTVSEELDSWLGILPEYNSNTTSRNYQDTPAFVRQYGTYEVSPVFEAVICVDNKWNPTTDTCQV